MVSNTEQRTDKVLVCSAMSRISKQQMFQIK